MSILDLQKIKWTLLASNKLLVIGIKDMDIHQMETVLSRLRLNAVAIHKINKAIQEAI